MAMYWSAVVCVLGGLIYLIAAPPRDDWKDLGFEMFRIGLFCFLFQDAARIFGVIR
jgi:hypothetical protein